MYLVRITGRTNISLKQVKQCIWIFLIKAAKHDFKHNQQACCKYWFHIFSYPSCETRRLQRDVVYLGWPIADPPIWAQMRGGGGGVVGSQPMSTASPNKLWRSNTIFILYVWDYLFIIAGVWAVLQGAGRGEPLHVLLPAERPTPGRAGHVQQAGNPLQQLPGILRRLPEVSRGNENISKENV
jgi:hypothetical protein